MSIKFLKQYFIPGEHNDYSARFFSILPLIFVLGFSLGVFVLGMLGQEVVKKNSLMAAVREAILVDMANTDRTASNLGGLTVNPILEQAAQLKANDMITNQYFDHISPTEPHKTPWHWFQQAGYPSFAWRGENLAIDFEISQNVHRAWMRSPGHRENIMNDKYTEVGIATATGLMDGVTTTVVVQMFGGFVDTERDEPAPLFALNTNETPTNNTSINENSGEVVTLETTPEVVAGEEVPSEEILGRGDNPAPIFLGGTLDTITDSFPSPDLLIKPELEAEVIEEALIPAEIAPTTEEIIVETPKIELLARNDVESQRNEVFAVRSADETLGFQTKVSMLERIMVSPALVAFSVLLIIVVLMIIALILNIVIHIRKQNTRSILIGGLTITFLVGLLILNYILAQMPVIV